MASATQQREGQFRVTARRRRDEREIGLARVRELGAKPRPWEKPSASREPIFAGIHDAHDLEKPESLRLDGRGALVLRHHGSTADDEDSKRSSTLYVFGWGVHRSMPKPWRSCHARSAGLRASTRITRAVPPAE